MNDEHQNSAIQENDMDLDGFELDEGALEAAAKRREQKLADDEKPIEADNDCGDACKI